MTPPQIRPAVEADADRIVEITWAVAEEGRWIGTEVPFDRAARRVRVVQEVGSTDHVLLVAEIEGRIVGHLGVSVARYGVADIGMMILDGWRGRGVGSALLGHAIDWARRAGAHKMALEVWPHNETAMALYRKFGFVEEGRKVAHYRRRDGALWDAVLMGLQLT